MTMRKINNNVEIGNPSKVDLKPGKTDKEQPKPSAEIEDNKIDDFSNPTEVLGRSQVSPSDNMKEDTHYAIKNPKAIERSDKLFEIALAKLQASGDPEAYEKACAIATCKDTKELLSR